MITKSNPYLFVFFAIFFLCLTIFLHLYKLGGRPDGFYCDEASIGYNAWSIVRTGADEYGNNYPLFFRCFDNYHEPVMVYSVAVLVKLFGLSEFIVRLPSALFLILASVAFYFLAKGYCRNKYIAMGAAFVFSVLPWIFPVSRVMMAGYSAMLLGICVGWLFMMKAFGGRSYVAAVLSAGGWAFAMYSHNCGRPVSAAILVVFTLCFYKMLLGRWKIYVLFASSFFIMMVPMIIAVARNPQILGSRFSQIAVWSSSSGIPETLQRIFFNYCSYFSPQYLFISGDQNLRHNSGFGGELYIFLVPLLIAGLFLMYFKLKKNPWYGLMLIGIFICPLAAVFTTGVMHSTRTLNGAPFWMILAVCGAAWLYGNRPRQHKLLAVIAFLAVFEVSLYMKHYFSTYSEISPNAFSAPFNNTLKYVFARMKENEKLYVSPTFFPHAVDSTFKPVWYSHFLFYGRVNPSEYQRHGLPGNIVPYCGRLSSPGYFIRSGTLIDNTGAVYPNFERIPHGAAYLMRIPCSINTYYEIYRIGPRR